MSAFIERDELSRDIAMGLLFSGLVDDFRGDRVATFCNEMADYLLKKYGDRAVELIGAGDALNSALNPLLIFDPREVARRRKRWDKLRARLAPPVDSELPPVDPHLTNYGEGERA